MHFFLLILIVLVGIAGVGYFAFKEGEIKNNYKTNQKTQTTSSSISPVQPEISIFDVSAQVIEDLKKVYSPEFTSDSTIRALTVNNETPKPSEKIHYSGSGFKPNSKVQIHSVIPEEMKVEEDFITQSDKDGNVEGDVTINSAAKPGRRLLVATDYGDMKNVLLNFALGKSTALHWFLCAVNFYVRE